MTPPLTDLISRLERASGPDRELDAELDCMFLLKDSRPALPDDCYARFRYSPGDIKTEHGFLQARLYTRSLDAALALVEAVRPGLTIHLSGMPHLAEAERRWMAQLETEAWKCVAEEYAGTAPLALLKTLLRSLEAAA